MTKFTDEGAASAERRPGGRPFNFAQSYAVVLVLVVVTYIVSVSVTEERATSIVLTIQLATVWFALRISHAPPGVRLVANIVLALAAIVAVVSFFVNNEGDQLGVISAVAASSTSSHHSRSCATSYSVRRSTLRRCSEPLRHTF